MLAQISAECVVALEIVSEMIFEGHLEWVGLLGIACHGG